MRFGVRECVSKITLAVGHKCWKVTLCVCSAAHAFCEIVWVCIGYTHTEVILPGMGRRYKKQTNCVVPPDSSVNRPVVWGFCHQPRDRPEFRSFLLAPLLSRLCARFWDFGDPGMAVPWGVSHPCVSERHEAWTVGLHVKPSRPAWCSTWETGSFLRISTLNPVEKICPV